MNQNECLSLTVDAMIINEITVLPEKITILQCMCKSYFLVQRSLLLIWSPPYDHETMKAHIKFEVNVLDKRLVPGVVQLMIDLDNFL